MITANKAPHIKKKHIEPIIIFIDSHYYKNINWHYFYCALFFFISFPFLITIIIAELQFPQINSIKAKENFKSNLNH